ncbi:MAG: hypothetical protein VKL39_23240 [Leptolyngbyaceae bacterium]|nr:hypothetical protein [Leptolyngbyaceae bacterium]
MSPSRWLKRLAPLLLSAILLLSACSSPASKYDQVQQETTGFRSEKAVDRDAEKGGTFNQFFPGSQGNYEVVPSQEKAGFAEYKLKQDGETVAMLTINDTISLPAAAVKYENATATISGYPAVNQGATATGILVNGRYQVKVLSRSDSFGQAEREAWIQKFDLLGLAELDGMPTSKIPAKPSPQNAATVPSTIEAPAAPEPASDTDLMLQPG